MGIISSIKEKRSNTSNLKDPKKWLIDFFNGGQETYAGKRVNEETALKTSAVYACVDRLSSAMAALPLQIHKRTDKGRETARNHFAYKMLHDEPNPEITSFTFRQLQMAHLLLWGNSYAEIAKDGANRARELWPVPPWKIEPKKDSQGVYYEVLIDKKRRRFEQEQILHIKGLGLDGLKGLSRIAMARQAIGLSLASEEFGARFFGNGAHPGGIVEYNGRLSDQAYSRYKSDMRKNYEGLGKSHRLMFLEEGMKYHETAIPPGDAQFLETRKFQLTEIARIYNVPLHLLQEHENSTTWGSGLEQLNIAFVVYSLTPYLENWEQEINKKIIKSKDYYAEHNVEGLLRGDSKARADFYRTMTTIGAYSINEVRSKENMNKIPNGDKHFVQLNMTPLEDSDSDDGEEENNLRKTMAKQFRQKQLKRSAGHRFQVEKSFLKVFEDAAGRILRREEADIMRQARKIFENNNESELLAFEEYLNDFYDEHPDYLIRQIRPPIAALSEAIAEIAAEEVNYTEDISDNIQQFDREYEEAFAIRHIRSSSGQLKKVANEAVAEDHDPLEDLQERFDNWQETRKEQIAMRETVQLASAVAVITYKIAGYIKKIWHAIGAETCEFCQEMDGKIVGIEEQFLSDDDKLAAEGREGEEMNINHGIGHPPLHSFCVCTVMPES